MASYKVIQDIEAEDKLVGPLSFRQFVYFLIAAFTGYLSFISLAKGAAFLLVIFVPPMIFCLFFAWPWSPDQPTEVWALARIRFYFKPRKRIWSQSGVKDFVTITVPKKIERTFTDGLSQTEIKSRLQALADTIDSRGWVIKNVNFDARVSSVHPDTLNSDRLLDFNVMPREVPDNGITASDDILDEVNNMRANQMGSLVNASTKARRQDILERMQSTAAPTPVSPTPTWFAPQPQESISQAPTNTLPPVIYQGYSGPTSQQLVSGAPTNNAAPTQSLSPVGLPPSVQSQAPVSRPQDPAILNLAHDNNLDVATLGREANRAHSGQLDDEVVVSLR